VSAPPFILVYTDEVDQLLDDLAKRPQYRAKNKKVKKTLKQLRDFDPSYPGLKSHKYSSLTGPSGEEVWESYIENNTPGAWRLFWIYGPDPDTITIVTLGPHPD